MFSRRRLLLSAVGLVAVVAPLAPAGPANAAPGYRIVDLGAGDNSTATAVNARGHVVGERIGHGFLLRDGRFTDLGVLAAGDFGMPTDINNRDEVVGASGRADTRWHASLWRNGVLTDLGVLPGGRNSYAEAVNDRGEVVGWSETGRNGELHAFVWRAGVMTDLGAAGKTSFAYDINDAGDIVGQLAGQAVRWRDGTAQVLSDRNAQAQAVNDAGTVTGIVYGGPTGFRWKRGTFTEIAPPSGAQSVQLRGINNRGQIVGGSGARAVLWQRGRLTVLPDESSRTGASANDINDRGVIVGTTLSGLTGPAPHAVLWVRR